MKYGKDRKPYLLGPPVQCGYCGKMIARIGRVQHYRRHVRDRRMSEMIIIRKDTGLDRRFHVRGSSIHQGVAVCIYDLTRNRVRTYTDEYVEDRGYPTVDDYVRAFIRDEDEKIEKIIPAAQ